MKKCTNETRMFPHHYGLYTFPSSHMLVTSVSSLFNSCSGFAAAFMNKEAPALECSYGKYCHILKFRDVLHVFKFPHTIGIF